MYIYTNEWNPSRAVLLINDLIVMLTIIIVIFIIISVGNQNKY